uniref:Uncharacterized protein n=1 Tax=Anguilla anguilla TaxID=7936 RepID=A0A0E9PHK7_ANGAN
MLYPKESQWSKFMLILAHFCIYSHLNEDNSMTFEG